ncbi:bifunctional serine/threonine-protein kinase/formylglycine-generating enzyme family protein [Microbulbifer yueqingensis]|uniref:non-specific serine/threonine protein kinase n=1 Tax=Microbulbifer yueqingensis TaxID=658219 RepID=A0A1G9A877_9GAMM|nr:bifunctional serine/threonine-protein kinase/formylglycine-generating enzyme family protein [Microbulbifer yueqingensis]SDK23498.1 serine/threonine-protein kinase PpkA [Microbulbifer yueqingensis]
MEVVSSNNSLEIPGYRILRKINQGGMSTVYLAVQRSVGRQVALKVMSPVLNADPIFSERFQREANIVGQLSHPNIVGIHDIGRFRSLNYIAMDYMPGGSVSDRLAQGVIEPMDAINITRQIALALDHAHGKGYVHRDLKPENILFREDGSAVLTDFGVARAVARTTRMTSSGMVVGTPHYMSPEQARGAAIDGRADLYSLGIVFYEMLTSVVPFQADEAVAIAIKHLTEPVPRLPARHSLYQGLIERFLAKDPEQRFQRGLDVVDSIDQLLATLAGKPAVQSTHANNTAVGTSSLLRALVMTLYGTLSDRVAAAWARMRDKPLDEKHPRTEQATIMRIQQVIQQAPERKVRQWTYGSTIVAGLLVAWLFLSLSTDQFNWWSGGSPGKGGEEPAALALRPAEGKPEASPARAAGVNTLSRTADDQGATGGGEDDLQAATAPTSSPSAIPAAASVDESVGTEGQLEDNATEQDVADPHPADESGATGSTENPTVIDQEGTSGSEQPESGTFALYINTSPADARVRIMNIAPTYRAGMELEPGKYDVEVSKAGYDSERRWVSIVDADRRISIKLSRSHTPGEILRPRLKDGGWAPSLVVVEPGQFIMGDDKRPTSSPAHKVNIKEAFAISRHEVTFNQYDRFAEATGAPLPGDEGWGRGHHPVINVTWKEAREYARWLSRQTGKRFRLPTEAEWEYAARGGEAKPFWWGDQDPRGKANCRRGCDSEFVGFFSAASAPVGQYDANGFGLFDTAGNVAEWTQDCFLADYNSSLGDGGAVKVRNCSLRTVRGGSMRDPLYNVSPAHRTGQSQISMSKEIGFRVVMELD